MSYIFKQKFNVSDLAALPERQSRVLIFGLDNYLCQLYASHLRLHSMDVKHCADWDRLKISIAGFLPHLLLVDLDSLTGPSDSRLRGLALERDFPSLILVTISRDLGAEAVNKLMRAGVSGHINRRLSRPRDVAVIAQSLLHHHI